MKGILAALVSLALAAFVFSAFLEVAWGSASYVVQPVALAIFAMALAAALVTATPLLFYQAWRFLSVTTIIYLISGLALIARFASVTTTLPTPMTHGIPAGQVYGRHRRGVGILPHLVLFVRHFLYVRPRPISSVPSFT